MNIREFSQNLEKLYAEMSLAFGNYQTSTGWNCLPGCGKCCLNPEIEASPLEMIPMALEIYDQGKLEEWIEKLETSTQLSCLVYAGDESGKGQCSLYNKRPSLCRMFGVAGYKNKKEEITLSVCKYIRQEYRLLEIPTGLPPEETPTFPYWGYRLTTLEQKLLTERVAINQAILLALQKVALYAQYQQLTPDASSAGNCEEKVKTTY